MITCLLDPAVFGDPNTPLTDCLVTLETPLHLWYPLNCYQMIQSDVKIYKDQNSNFKAFLVFSNQYVVINLDFDAREARIVYNIDTNFQKDEIWFLVIFDRFDNFLVKYIDKRRRPYRPANAVTFRKFDFERNM